MRNLEASLLASNRQLFHIGDLKVIWDTQNPNTLRKAISRLIKRQVLYSVQRGLYSTTPVDKLDKFKLGLALVHIFSYITTESILEMSGIISQPRSAITLVSLKPKRFRINDQEFLIRQLKPEFLFNSLGVKDRGDGVLTATIPRAVADLLYFDPDFHLDGEKLVDWEAVRQIREEVGYI